MKAAPDLKVILDTLEDKKFKIFDNSTKNYNINLVGVRSNDMTPNVYNDWEYVFWRYGGSWEVMKFNITTDPGLFYLKNPLNELGTAILKPGQYPGCWQRGKHKNAYPALVQVGNMTVFRDADRDENYDINGKEETGLFGINNHRAVENGRSIMVDKWSAGCQVFQDYYQYEIFMRLVSEAEKSWTNLFSYTLLTEKELKIAA